MGRTKNKKAAAGHTPDDGKQHHTHRIQSIVTYHKNTVFYATFSDTHAKQ